MAGVFSGHPSNIHETITTINAIDIFFTSKSMIFEYVNSIVVLTL